MFSTSSVSELFHVANFGRAPHPFFFLAPSRNRGRGDHWTGREYRDRIHTRRELDVFPRLRLVEVLAGGLWPRSQIKSPSSASSFETEIAWERYPIRSRAYGLGAQNKGQIGREKCRRSNGI